MPDKKVSKSVASRPPTPSQKLEASLSDSGTVNMAEPGHDKARSALVDKFKDREERWRREQAQEEQQRESADASTTETGTDNGMDAQETVRAPKGGVGPESSEAEEGGDL